MEKLRFVGLDVHKDSVTIAVADADGSVPMVVATVPSSNALVIKQLKKLGPVGTLSCCYEAGPTGLGLHRALEAAGISCIVVAPSLVPRKAGDRVKTDSRDAAKLARFLRSGDLTAIHVHDEQTEAMRDLERARDDAKNAERVARGIDRLSLAQVEPEPEPVTEPDFFTIAVSIATIRRKIARPACDAGSVVSERTPQASTITADSIAERLAIR